MLEPKLNTKLLTVAGCLSLGLLFTPSVAVAQNCETDDDCGAGMICEEGASGCADILILCEEGADCPQPDCESETVKYCTQAPCEDDDECGADQVCYAYTYEVCDEAGDCEEEQTDAYCTAKYNVPCEVSADCGGGFTCVEGEVCSCPGASADDELVAEAECTCGPSGDFYCELEELPCGDDEDCPGSLACGENFRGGACEVSADGETTCEEPEAVNVCMPREWTLSVSLGVAEVAATSGPAADGSVTTAAASSGVADPDVAAQSATSDGPVTATADSNGEVDMDDGATEEGARSTGDATDDAMGGDGAQASDGGCQFSPAGIATQPSAWSALLLALGLVARRRRNERVVS